MHLLIFFIYKKNLCNIFVTSLQFLFFYFMKKGYCGCFEKKIAKFFYHNEVIERN